MSFILEALKKVDRKKGDDAQDGVVMQGGRRWGDPGFPWLLTSVVLVAIAAFALAAVALLRSFPSGGTGEVEPARQAPAARGQAPALPSPSVPQEEGAVSDAVPLAEAQDSPDDLRDERVSGADSGDRVEEGESTEQIGTTEEAEGVAAAPPVRLVGRTGEGAGPVEVGESADAEPPSGLPPLVLQGTSVIDGRPVAVVNYQRLFEGDFIEGARVVKILDRAVELEYEGTRFTLRL